MAEFEPGPIEWWSVAYDAMYPRDAPIAWDVMSNLVVASLEGRSPRIRRPTASSLWVAFGVEGNAFETVVAEGHQIITGIFEKNLVKPTLSLRSVSSQTELRKLADQDQWTRQLFEKRRSKYVGRTALLGDGTDSEQEATIIKFPIRHHQG